MSTASEVFNFRFPAAFVTYLTIVGGGTFVLWAWILVFLDRARGTQWRIPTALFLLTASVGIDLVGAIVVSWFEFKHVGGFFDEVASLWSSFLIGNFVCVLVSSLVVKRDSGPAKHTVRMGSIVLLVIAGLGLIWYIA